MLRGLRCPQSPTLLASTLCGASSGSELGSLGLLGGAALGASNLLLFLQLPGTVLWHFCHCAGCNYTPCEYLFGDSLRSKLQGASHCPMIYRVGYIIILYEKPQERLRNGGRSTHSSHCHIKELPKGRF